MFVAVAALLSKKANAPVMMRITRDDEHHIGRARPALHSRVKIGFRKDGRITALDGFVVVDNGPYDVVSDSRSAGDHISLSYQPMAMRWRTLTVLTNTPPRGAQRAPGGMQGNALMEPIAGQGGAQARDRRGGDSSDQRARGQGPVRRAERAAGARTTRPARSSRRRSTKAPSCSNGRSGRRGAGKRNGSKVRGVGVAVSAYSAGSMGFDGLLVIKPDGRLMIQSGIGNLGTESVFDVPSRRRRGARRALGEMRRDLRQHGEEPAEHVRAGRQPDDARDDARGARGGDRREEEAAGDRGEDARRKRRVVPGGQRTRVERRPQPDVRAGGAEGDRARRQVRRS